LRINPQVHLTPLATIVSAVLLGFPFTFTEHLDAGAVDKPMQASCRWLHANGDR